MIEFQLLDIWSKFHRMLIVSYYTHSCACSNESSETEHSCHGDQIEAAGLSYSTCHVASRASMPCRISGILPWRMWQKKSHAVGGCVPTGPGHPHRTLCVGRSTVQWTRWLAVVGWQAFKRPSRVVGGSVSLCMLPGWAKQTMEFMTSVARH